MAKVNKEKCIGCGYCISICQEVFEFGDDGKSKVKENADLEKNKDCFKEAKKGCPMGAIEND